jgi:hypothetical protein
LARGGTAIDRNLNESCRTNYRHQFARGDGTVSMPKVATAILPQQNGDDRCRLKRQQFAGNVRDEVSKAIHIDNLSMDLPAFDPRPRKIQFHEILEPGSETMDWNPAAQMGRNRGEHIPAMEGSAHGA